MTSKQLIRAVQQGNITKASALIATYGLSHSKAWSGGYILLCDALERKHRKIAKILLKHGCRVNSKTHCQKDTPLHFAVKNEDTSIVAMLLHREANVEARNNSGQTPLHLSVGKKNSTIVSLLLQKNADVNAQNDSGKTPLHCACQRKCNDKIVDTLLEFGAEIDRKDSNDSTPLHIAAFTGSLRIVQTLLKSFADVKCTDKDGKTALHVASECGWSKVVKELLDYGADPKVTCKKGRSPFDYANPELLHDNENLADRFCRFLLNELINHDCEFDYEYHNNEDHSDSDQDDYHDFFDGDLNFQGDYCNASKTAATIKQHMTKIKALNIRESERNFRSAELNDKATDFLAKCKREVRLMKIETIGETNITYYDILTKSINRLAIFARNQDIVEDLESARCEEKLPIYWKMAFYKFKKGQKRMNLSHPSLNSFNHLSRFLLPELASLKVLNMLSNKDLENLVKAVPET